MLRCIISILIETGSFRLSRENPGMGSGKVEFITLNIVRVDAATGAVDV